jgi:hypothetical protein
MSFTKKGTAVCMGGLTLLFQFVVALDRCQIAVWIFFFEFVNSFCENNVNYVKTDK